MRLGYTIWHRDHFKRLPEVLKNTADVVDYYVLVLAAQVDTQGKWRFNISPFISLPDYIKLVQELKLVGKPIWLKPQLHPHPRTLPKGCKPEWWPGYVKCPDRSIPLLSLISIYIQRRFGDLSQVEYVQAGTELAWMVNKANWKLWLKTIKAMAGGKVKTLYGANFWQPIAWHYRGWIKLAYWLGYEEAVLKAILQGTPFENANTTVLAQVIKEGMLDYSKVKYFDRIGLSCYFWPSMVCNVADIQRAYENYTFKLGWLKFSFSYPQLAAAWSAEFNERDMYIRGGVGLIVTESGPVYMSELGRNCRHMATKWWLITMHEFEQVSCECFTVWEDTGVGAAWEALKIYARR